MDEHGVKFSWPIILVIAVVISFGLGVVAGPILFKGSAAGTTGDGKVKFDIPSYATYKGSGSASTYVIEFGDYQCPFCERFFQQTEPQIVKNYVDTGKARFYFIDFQFLGPDSQTLGQGAWCANDQGKYYDYHDYVYSHQGEENSGWATPDKVKTLAKSITGLDTNKFNSCLDSKKYESRVTELTQLGQSAGVTGTPTTFIGNPSSGYILVSGARPYSDFQQLLG